MTTVIKGEALDYIKKAILNGPVRKISVDKRFLGLAIKINEEMWTPVFLNKQD